MSEPDFESKVAIVTGGGSGIGAACVQLLVERGAKVLVADVDPVAAEKVASQFLESARPFAVDVSDSQRCELMVQRAIDTWGGLHIAVNNAGIGGEQNPIGSYSVEGWRSVLSVNLDGVFYCMRHELTAMKRSGGGSIINMASILGAVGFANSSGYVAAKHGVLGLTQTAAIEYAADGIRVNSVGPGFIQTPLLSALPQEAMAGIAALHPMNRLGTPQEVAELVLFLASPASSFITGGYYPVDGGYLAR